MSTARRSRLKVMTPEVADRLRRALVLTNESPTFYLRLSQANMALFLMGDPAVALAQLPKIGSKPMRRIVERLGRAAVKARAAGDTAAADELDSLLPLIDEKATEIWRVWQEIVGETATATDKPLKPGVCWFADELRYELVDADGERIVDLTVSRARGLNKHDRAAIEASLWEMLYALDPRTRPDDGDVDDDATEGDDLWRTGDR